MPATAARRLSSTGRLNTPANSETYIFSKSFESYL
jgi:hypothetical protein